MSCESVSRQTVEVGLENGLHMVPCSLIVKTAGRFECAVQIHKGDLSVDAKIMLDLLTLNAQCGTTLVLEARGTDASQAIGELVRLFETDFQTGSPVEG
jgi:phosphotransferase system HPr (HPr) family protein